MSPCPPHETLPPRLVVNYRMADDSGEANYEKEQDGLGRA